ncbi:hypothetical protein [Miniimonas sp. S16]|uniref:hypothetical protein n=1 Tax=Miniimonas sp. S16 TaxID=2171623 RepID=UPI00131F069A|nr:hypothetical protein [Miniimonas sp. S16]
MRQGCLGLVVGVLLIAGCSPSGTGGDTTPSTPSASASASAPASPASPEVVTPGEPQDDSVASPDGGVPVWDDSARSSAATAAVAVMGAFARPDLGYEEWWAGLEPLLSPAAAEVYASVDPVNVPARTVTGAAVVVDESSPYVAFVQVPTDAGTYTVLLSRESAATAWLGERITPPEAASG